MEAIDIEVVTKNYSKIPMKEVISVVGRYLRSNHQRPNTIISKFDQNEHRILYDDVDHIIIGDLTDFDGDYIDFTNQLVNWHVYSLDTLGPKMENEEDGDGGEINLATHWLLPSAELYNLWENLHYDDNIKEKLLRYATTIMEFSDRGIDCNVVSCNRVILLHGPPGTGKTSLCKALAHKLSIHMQERYSGAILVEINSHSLFSKWFSESGKLVTKIFSKIRDMLEDRNMLVCVLVDEIESLAHARVQCMSGNEPSDSIRVVNAVLTQIDHIKRHPNALILTTSNMTEAIDVAFVDRADIKQFLGLPSVPAIYKIYYSCLQELRKAEIVSKRFDIYPVSSLRIMRYTTDENSEVFAHSKRLIDISERSKGLSGRSLRKIPFLAHALFLKHKTVHSLDSFLDAMEKAVEHECKERKHFSK